MTDHERTLRAYHNSEDLKLAYLARVAEHRVADDLVQGTGWEDGRGCAVGCTLESYEHARYPIELGVPLQLAHLEDRIFEGLPPADAMLWPERFLDAIPVGADLSAVWPDFAVWLLTDETHGTRQYLTTDEQRAATDRVAELYRARVPYSDGRWRAAAYAADAAAYAAAAYAAAYAADAAAYAAAAYAADSAYAYAYAAAADADAAAAAYNATAYAADSAADSRGWYRAAADKLCTLLEAAR